MTNQKKFFKSVYLLFIFFFEKQSGKFLSQCWTEGRSSTAVAEDLRPTAMATATVAEDLDHSYGRRSYL